MNELEQLKFLAEIRENFPKYADLCLKIKAKSGQMMPLRLNKAQLYAHKLMEEQRAATGKVRALILKARQQGFSTYVGARFYHRASLNHGTNVFILTHEQAATDNLFSMVVRYHTNAPLKPHTGAANAKELVFDKLDSGYSVATAGQKAVGRSKTIHLFHGSEVAFWPNASDHFGASVQGVPDLPGTEIILESTANGVTGEFYERWQQAEAGVGDFIPIFSPWFWDDGYRRKPPEGFTLNSERPSPEELSEVEVAELFGLDMEQMCWRRNKIAELKDPMLFKQEYPATADEAFQATGHDSFIKSGIVLRARKFVVEEPLGALVLGVDPARFGDDLFAIVWRRGRKILKYETIQKCDTVQGANRLKQIIDKDNPARVFIDAGGIGGGVYDLLCSYGSKYNDITVGVNFGGEPQEPTIMLDNGEPAPGPKNRRAEMWMRSKEWLMDPMGVDIPDVGIFQSDAVGPSYKYDSNQRIQLESKESMRKRGVRSPDVWDAVALTFAEPVYERRDDASARPSLPQYSSDTASLGWMAL